MQITNYFKFRGVATRSEFWAVTIINFLTNMVLSLIAGLLFASSDFGAIVGAVFFVSILILSIWLALATCARRCRDAGINPWWTTGLIIPYVAIIIWIVVGVLATKTTEELT